MSNIINPDIVEKVIMQAYLAILKKCTPTITSIHSLIDDVVERNAYNIIYSDVSFKSITEDDVRFVLVKYRCLYNYCGEVYFDAQNVLFPDWLPTIKLLEGGFK